MLACTKDYPILALTVGNIDAASADFAECVVVSMPELVDKQYIFFLFQRKPLKHFLFAVFMLVSSGFADANNLTLLQPEKQRSMPALRK